MLGLVRRHPRYGYRRVWALLRAEGFTVNRKRVYRLWRKEGLKVPQKQCKKRRLGSSENGIIRRASCGKIGGRSEPRIRRFIYDSPML